MIPGRDPVPLSAAVVSGTFFKVLGSGPLLGRVFDAKDDDPQAPSAGWCSVTRRGRNSSAPIRPSIGRRVMIREEAAPQSFEVIGVMPPGIFLPARRAVLDARRRRGSRRLRDTRNSRAADLFDKLGVFYALGRLKNGVSVSDARNEMPLYLKGVADEFRIDLSNFRIVVTPLHDFIFGPARRILWLLMGPSLWCCSSPAAMSPV